MPWTHSVDDDVHALKDHLPPGEAVLWTGRPLPGHAAWSGVPGPTHAARVAFLVLGAVAVIPFVVAGAYICWTAARSFFEFERMEVVLGAPLLFTFGFVIAVAPPYLLVRPRLRHLHLAKTTRYVLTSSHARALHTRTVPLAVGFPPSDLAETVLIAAAPGAHVVDSTTCPFKHLRPGVRLAPVGPEFHATVL